MNYLTERIDDGRPLHIYVNSDKFTNENCNIVMLYGEEVGPTYSVKFNGEDLEKQIDYLMGLIGRDTRNWSHKDIVIHWGNNVWKFYNEFNINDFEKEEYEEFGIDKFDYDNLH